MRKNWINKVCFSLFRLSFLRKQESRLYSLVPKNSKGISVLFLLIAMMLVVAIGYVFSYLIPAKQKSEVFSIQSTQAFFIAQSGVEFAIRYAQVNGVGALNGMTRSLRDDDDIAPIGRFSLIYNSAGTGTLTSVGEVPIGIERRRITVSNFTQFLSQSGLVLWTPAPCRVGNIQIRFNIRNVGSVPIILNRFSATWTVPPFNRDITSITFGTNIAFSGIYNYPNCTPCIRNFTANQTINPNNEITISVTWDQNITGQLPATISFYDTTGIQYQFTLNPTGSC